MNTTTIPKLAREFSHLTCTEQAEFFGHLQGMVRDEWLAHDGGRSQWDSMVAQLDEFDGADVFRAMTEAFQQYQDEADVLHEKRASKVRELLREMRA